jgi:hypothetical protein
MSKAAIEQEFEATRADIETKLALLGPEKRRMADEFISRVAKLDEAERAVVAARAAQRDAGGASNK